MVGAVLLTINSMVGAVFLTIHGWWVQTCDGVDGGGRHFVIFKVTQSARQDESAHCLVHAEEM